MIGNARLGANLGFLVVDDHAIVEVVGVRVHVGIVRNRRTLVNDDFAAIIQQHVFVDGAVVFDGQVVAKRNFHPVKNLHVLSAVLEYMAGQHGAHAKSQPVIQADGRTVIHHPEPDERLTFGVFRGVHVAVVFRFKRGISWIKRVDQRLLRQRCGQGLVRRTGGQVESV